jgi:hypothetical protein
MRTVVLTLSAVLLSLAIQPVPTEYLIYRASGLISRG